jgi:class 3 adenylate cyclase
VLCLQPLGATIVPALMRFSFRRAFDITFRTSELLRPGERISVGSLTVLFTDLRGSTRFYQEIGDAPAWNAYRRVRTS